MFADDVLQCPSGGRGSVIAVVTDPALASTLLTALELPAAGDVRVFGPASKHRAKLRALVPADLEPDGVDALVGVRVKRIAVVRAVPVPKSQ